jgi:hypothetical protein
VSGEPATTTTGPAVQTAVGSAVGGATQWVHESPSGENASVVSGSGPMMPRKPPSQGITERRNAGTPKCPAQRIP